MKSDDESKLYMNAKSLLYLLDLGAKAGQLRHAYSMAKHTMEAIFQAEITDELAAEVEPGQVGAYLEGSDDWKEVERGVWICRHGDSPLRVGRAESGEALKAIADREERGQVGVWLDVASQEVA